MIRWVNVQTRLGWCACGDVCAALDLFVVIVAVLATVGAQPLAAPCLVPVGEPPFECHFAPQNQHLATKPAKARRNDCNVLSETFVWLCLLL